MIFCSFLTISRSSQRTFAMSAKSANCIFCKIVEKTSPSEIKFENDEILIFKDIKPAAKYHFLSIPKEHIVNVNSLTTSDHKRLLDTLMSEGKRILQEQGGDVNDCLLGFHLPPFNTVGHLHLHVIAPVSNLSFLQRWILKPNTWWFATAEQIQEKLGTLIGDENHLNNKL